MSLSVFAAAAESPDRIALVTDGDAWTFAELAARVLGRVERLRLGRLDGTEPVALVATHDPPTLEAIHALMATGTPALLLHPRLTEAERSRLIGAVDALDGAQVTGGALAAPPTSPPPPPPADDERPLAIVHTSGTGGEPKGVVLSRRAFVASAAASEANLGWREDDRWLLPLPLAHVGGLSIVTRCLLARRAVVLAPETRPRELVETAERHRATILSLVPTLLRRILDLDPPIDPPRHLRALLLGGAAASPDLLTKAADRGWPVLTTYGLSEACSQVTTQRYGTVNRGEAGSGPPLPGIELRIADDDAIHVRGPVLFSGYTPGRDALLPGGWLETGDRGRIDPSGNLHVLGRRTDRIVTGGENVDPVEVESALEGLPGIGAACVFGLPDPEWGEVVCAAVVAESGARGEGGEEAWARVAGAVRGLRRELAPFKVPRRLAIVESLPKNRSGKLDRRRAAREAESQLEPL